MKLGAALSSDKPVVTILTVVVVAVAVIVGGVVTITNPQSLTFSQYLRDIALLGAGLGLGNGVGRGIESAGRTTPAPVAAAEDGELRGVGGSSLEEPPPFDDR